MDVALDALLSTILAALDTAGTVAHELRPVVGVLSYIQKVSEEIRANKNACRALAKKSAVLQEVITGTNTPDERIRDALTELETTARSVYDKVKIWTQYSLVKAFFYRGKVNAGVVQCTFDLDLMLQKLQITGIVRSVDVHAEAMSRVEANQAALLQSMHEIKEGQELRRLSAAILQDPSSVQEAADMQRNGDPVADMIMRHGQKLLKESRHSGSYMTEEERERISQGLVQLQRLADILPAIKRLDGEVVRTDDFPIRCHSHHHQIYRGLWQNHVVVALKTQQEMQSQTSTRAIKRLVRELEVWSRLKHEHIQGFFGITTNIGIFVNVVSEWRMNGNLREYAEHTANVDKVHLLSGAASGLAYLHSERIMHGNVRCRKILVSDEGEALICDFGMARIIADIQQNGILLSETLSHSSSSRWMAPELIHEDVAVLTFACDVWSFGMTMLELFTMHDPWAECKRDAHVNQATREGLKPVRPQPCPQLTDHIWAIMLECWEKDPTKRPVMATVTSRIQGGADIQPA